VAQRKDVGDHYFWGVGVALQFKWLVERGVITASCLPRIFEGRRDGTRFKLLNEIVHKIYTQVVESITHEEKRFRVESKVLTEVRDFFVSCDLFVYDLFEPIEKLNEIAHGNRARKEFQELKQSFERIHRHHDADIYRNNWQGERSGYQIYRMACHWVAVRPEIKGGIVDALSVIDLEELAPMLLIDDEFDMLVARAAAHAQTYAAQLNTAEGNSLAELERLGRAHIDLMHRAVHEYSHSVQIYRQATLLGRKFSRAVIYPIERLARFGRRLVTK
jgi:hypothetical protein